MLPCTGTRQIDEILPYIFHLYFRDRAEVACPGPLHLFKVSLKSIAFKLTRILLNKKTKVSVLRIRDPGSGAFLTPWIRDPGWVKTRIRIRDEQHGSYFQELRNNFLGLKYLNL
jgi:hypothetical protein